ncbi:YihY/virulence factor BrkB family protein [Solimonas soli]|uniref:YihY/virulence factor BrkB family protein n=1 Tax=Solimonas soli TaxID=413479 RepID=UPI0004AFE64F|nr:YihY/virulence factor BrkB family protein [Solimonas soli]
MTLSPATASARLRDLRALGTRALAAWIDDGAASMGAALAFYTVLSMAPVLLIVIGVAGLFFGEDAARGALMAQIGDLLGRDGASAVQSVLASAARSGGGLASMAIGFATLFIGATTVFAELQYDLDRIWKSPRQRHSGVLAYLKARLLSFGVILGVGFLLAVSLVLSAAISAVATIWGGWLGGALLLLRMLNAVAGFIVTTALFALIYKVLPRVQLRWRDVIGGAAITALLFAIGKLLIGLYIGHAAFMSSFGAAGTLIAVIVWVYYSAQIFLLGAEFTCQLALRDAPQATVAP